MQMIPVSSSDLAAVGYAGTTLWISFHSGGLYEYSGVPQSVYESLMNAPSKGKYFHAYIKRSYPYRRIGQSMTTSTMAGPFTLTSASW